MVIDVGQPETVAASPAELSGNQRLLRLIEEVVDPATFRGMSDYHCAVGQVGIHLGFLPDRDLMTCWVAEATGADLEKVRDVYWWAYGRTYEETMEYCRAVLG